MRWRSVGSRLTLLLLVALTSACERPLQVRAVALVMPPPGAPFLGSTDATVDGIFLEMSKVVAIADSPTDVACAQGLQAQFPDSQLLPLLFKRENAVQLVSGPRIIADESTLQAAFADPGVTAVGLIISCGGMFGDYAGSGETPGASFAVLRQTTLRFDGVIWAHEYGHNMGLPHRNEPRALMADSGNEETVELNANECIQMAVGPTAQIPPVTSITPKTGAVERTHGPALMNLVRNIHFHGMPFVTPEVFSSNDLDSLVALLDDPAERAYRPNVAILLGMLGHSREELLLIDLIDRSRSAEMTWAEARGLPLR